MKYSLRILKKKNLFKRLKYPSPNAMNIKYFDTQLQLLGIFRYHETIQSLTSRKRYAQKTSGCGTGRWED